MKEGEARRGVKGRKEKGSEGRGMYCRGSDGKKVMVGEWVKETKGGEGMGDVQDRENGDEG